MILVSVISLKFFWSMRNQASKGSINFSNFVIFYCLVKKSCVRRLWNCNLLFLPWEQSILCNLFWLHYPQMITQKASWPLKKLDQLSNLNNDFVCVWFDTFDRYLFHLIVLLNADFSCSYSFYYLESIELLLEHRVLYQLLQNLLPLSASPMTRSADQFNIRLTS